MPKQRSPDSYKAEEMYKQGMKLVEIASQLNLPEGTVRRWKCTYKWDSERSEKKANVRKEKSKGSQEIDHSEKEQIFEQLENSDLSDKQRLFALTILELSTRQNPIKKHTAAAIRRRSPTGRHYSEILG